jgi:hypothetical protein
MVLNAWDVTIGGVQGRLIGKNHSGKAKDPIQNFHSESSLFSWGE